MNTNVTDSTYAAIPILFSADLRRSAMFYSDGLGFAVYRENDGLRVRRNELDLKIAQTDDIDLISNLNVVFRVRDLQKLYREFAGKSLQNLGKLKKGMCGKFQFSLTDPDGNSLYFVETA